MSELIPLVPSDRPEMPLGVRRSSSSVKLTNDAPVTLSVLTVMLLGFSEVASLWGVGGCWFCMFLNNILQVILSAGSLDCCLSNSVQSTESVVVNYTGQNQSKIKAEVWNYGHEAGIH